MTHSLAYNNQLSYNTPQEKEEWFEPELVAAEIGEKWLDMDLWILNCSQQIFDTLIVRYKTEEIARWSFRFLDELRVYCQCKAGFVYFLWLEGKSRF